MNTILKSSRKPIIIWLKTISLCFLFLYVLAFSSCQKDSNNLLSDEYLKGLELSALSTGSQSVPIIYFDHKTFTRTSGTPFVEIVRLENSDFEHFDGNFVLKIQNGKDKATRVSSAEIWVDGVLVVGPSAFSKNVSFITKQISGLTHESVLEVKLNSSPGGFIDLCIEGTLKKDHALITNLGGNFSFLNGLITFKIPPEALESPTFISVRDITSELPEEIKSKVGFAFDFLPDGMQFAHPISVELKVPESIELHQSAFLGPLDIESGSLLWYPSEVLMNERIISSEINHFSSWSALWASYFEPKTYSYTLLNLPTNLEGYHGEPSETYEYLLNNDVKRAFNKWEAYSKSAGITFKATTSVDAEISIKFLSKSDLRLFYELMLGNKWAGMVLWDLFSERKVIILNDFYFWHVTTDLILNIHDFEYIEHVVTHEIGHFFGLNDYKDGPYKNNSIMGYGVGLPIPLCDIDVKNIKSEYPEVKCAYGSASEMRILDLNNLGYPGQIMNDLKLIVTDENGFGVPNVPVYIRYDLIEYFNNIPHTIVETDANGIATINNVKLPDKLGNFKIRATTLLGGETGINTLVEYFNIDVVAGDIPNIGCSNLKLTSSTYPETTSNLTIAIQNEFGSSYVVADWHDLTAISNIDEWISCMGLVEDQTFLITYGGNRIFGGARHYYVHYSSDGLPYPQFGVHAQIGNKLFLGSWYGLNYKILAKRIN